MSDQNALKDRKPRSMSGVEYIGTFNSEGRGDVEEIKEKAADLIDTIKLYGHDPRRNAIAITHIEEAAMMAVKSIFA